MGLVYGRGLVLRTKVEMGKKSGGMDGSRKIKVGNIQVRKRLQVTWKYNTTKGKKLEAGKSLLQIGWC